jgi:hypothetical protein
MAAGVRNCEVAPRLGRSTLSSPPIKRLIGSYDRVTDCTSLKPQGLLPDRQRFGIRATSDGSGHQHHRVTCPHREPYCSLTSKAKQIPRNCNSTPNDEHYVSRVDRTWDAR